jgi:hypothetical protein
VEYAPWIIIGVSAIVVIISFASIIRSSKQTKIGFSNQAEARECGDKMLALQAETNQLLRELISTLRDKR